MSKKLYNQFATSFILPEHGEALERDEKAFKEKELKHIPEFDEQQFELWEQILQKSMLEKTKIKVRFMKNSGPFTIEGIVSGANPHLKIILVANPSGAAYNISLDKIMKIEE